MVEIETDDGVDGGFDFERLKGELRKLKNDADGYLVLFCPSQGSLRVERRSDGYTIERRREVGKTHYEIRDANQGRGLSLTQAEQVCRQFFDNSSVA